MKCKEIYFEYGSEHKCNRPAKYFFDQKKKGGVRYAMNALEMHIQAV